MHGMCRITYLKREMICGCGSITMRGGGGVVSYRATVLNAEDLQLWHRPRCPQRLQQV